MTLYLAASGPGEPGRERPARRGRVVTRWVTPEGVRVDLGHQTHPDGWWLRLTHPRSGVTLTEVPLDLDHRDPKVRDDAARAIRTALDAINACPVIQRRRAEKR